MPELGTVKLRDMRQTQAEQREDMDFEPPDFPFGLQLHLDEDEIRKLGIDLPDIGESFVIVGIGTVTSVSQHQSEERTNQHVAVQLEKLAFESREDSVSLRTDS